MNIFYSRNVKRIAERSQYFLRSPTIVKELLGHSNIKKIDTVIDIGAGSGIISAVLAQRCKRVIAYEFDNRLSERLRQNLSSFNNIEIVSNDFLNSELPHKNYKVFANIPFHLSSPILNKLVWSSHKPHAIYLIVQKQFANKLLINDRRFTGLLGASIAPLYTTKIRKRLQKSDYLPHPAVDTVLVELLLRETPLIAPERVSAYRECIDACFSDPKIFARMPRNDLNIPTELKPSQLTTDQWISLFKSQNKY